MELWNRLRAARALPPTMTEMNEYFLQLYATIKKPSGVEASDAAMVEASLIQEPAKQTAPKKETSRRSASKKEAKAAV
jgi:hypothetical protein